MMMMMTMGMMIMEEAEKQKRLNLDYNAENSCLHFHHCYCFITIIVVVIVDEVDIGNDVDVERMGGKGRGGCCRFCCFPCRRYYTSSLHLTSFLHLVPCFFLNTSHSRPVPLLNFHKSQIPQELKQTRHVAAQIKSSRIRWI